MTNRVFIPGIYQHYKGARYVALAVARNATNGPKFHDGLEVVVYRPLNGDEWFVRSKDEFLSIVESDSSTARFTLETPFEPTNYKEPTDV